MWSERSCVGRRRSVKLPATTSTYATFTIPSSHCEGHGCARVVATSLSLLSHSLPLLHRPLALFLDSAPLVVYCVCACARALNLHLAHFAIKYATRSAIRRIERGSLHGVAPRVSVRPVWWPRVVISLFLFLLTAGSADSAGIRESLRRTRVERSRAGDCAAKCGAERERPEAE